MRVFFTALFLLVLTGCSASAPQTALVGNPAPYARLTLMDGSMVPLTEYEGRPSVLLFWASHCSRSKSVIRDIDDAARKYKSIPFIAVSIDKLENMQQVKAMIRDRDLSALRHSFSGNDVHDEVYVAFEVDELPTVVMLDASGRIVARGGSVDTVEEGLEVINRSRTGRTVR